MTAVVIPFARVVEGEAPLLLRKPGRPRRAATAPMISQRAYEEAVAAEAERAIAEDGLVVASSDTQRTEPHVVVSRAIGEVANESAALLWERRRATQEGRDSSKLSSRRVAALLRIGELAVLKEQLARDSGDLDPQHVAQAVEMLIEAVEEAVRDVAEPEVANRFMSRLKKKMTDANFPASVTGAP